MFEGKVSTDKWFPMLLVDGSNVGQTAKGTGDITVKYSYEAATSLTTYSPGASDWKEAGEGVYWLQIGASEFTSAGKYKLLVACAGCVTYRQDIEVKSYTENEVGVYINYMYGRVGTPSDLGSGATLSFNAVDIDTLLNTVDGKVDTAIIDIGTANVSINNVYSRVGAPVDLGDGTPPTVTVVDMLTSMAGKTAGAASFNREYDSLEAISDAESDNLSVTALKDLLFKRRVTNRHANGKPSTILAAEGTANQQTVTTTLDGTSTYIETENYS